MSDLVGNPEDRFSRVEARLVYFLLLSYTGAGASVPYHTDRTSQI